VNHLRLDRRTGGFVDQAPVFHRVVSYGPQAENVAQSLRRGIEVVVVATVGMSVCNACWNPRTAASVLGPKIPSTCNPLLGSPDRLRNWNSS
jgi:hypothetical protein